MTHPENPVASDEVQPLVDPTICADCRKDNGDAEFPTIGGRHLCSRCRSHVKGVRFPIWMKIASAATFLLAILGIPRSIRQARGIYAYRLGVIAFLDERNPEAVDHLVKARALMPEEREFEDLEAYYRGHLCMNERKFADAAKWFQLSLNLDPDSKTTARMLIQAQRHAAFELGNYDRYFHASETLMELDGRTPEALLAMAPAWACRFVLTGREEFRQQALSCLSDAKNSSAAKDAERDFVEAWVKQMMEKRTIVSFRDFWFSIGKGGLDDEGIG